MKKVVKYGIIFAVFLFSILIAYHFFFGDSIVNYGFSYAIQMGEIPYRDFNLVLPLFSPFFYALPLFLYNSSLTFYITQAILLTVLFYLLEKKIENNVYLFFFFIFLGYPLLLPTGLFPGYNFLLFFLIVLLGFLEEKKASDILIGFVIGLAILTKHTIGVFLILPSFFFYHRDLKKIGKRLLGACIPIVIFLLYLILTKTLSSFLDLCVFGLFDFANKNHGRLSIILLLEFLICFGYFIYSFHKEKKIETSYLFFSFLFILPILDEYHLSYFIYATMILLLSKLSIKEKWKKIEMIGCLFMICVWTFIVFCGFDHSIYSYPSYPLRFMSSSMVDNYEFLSSCEKKYGNDIVLFLLGTENYFYKITNHQRITYFDLPNYGNYGYDGFSKMKKQIDEKKNTYFVILKMDSNNFSYHQQYYKELAQYIMEKGTMVDENIHYGVYYVE